jgi:hypothetical protein
MNKMMIKPIIKKIIEFLEDNESKISQIELNEWLEDMGYNYLVTFENGEMKINEKVQHK